MNRRRVGSRLKYLALAPGLDPFDVRF